MSKSLIPTKLYKDITNLLYNEGLIEVIPPQKWTTNDKVYGYLKTQCWLNIRTQKVTEKYIGVYINKKACPCTLNDFIEDPKGSLKDFFELVDTICHELAHMTYHDHSQNHKDLTNKYKDLFYEKSGLMSGIDQVVDYLTDCKEV